MVAAYGAVTVWEIAPPSDQVLKASCVLAPDGCVATVAMVCVLPAAHTTVQGAAQALPSTVRGGPAGLATMVWVKNGTKFAVTPAGPAMAGRFCGLVTPLSAPVKPENWYPLLAWALTEGDDPALYQPLAGWIVPPLAAAVVR